MYVFVFAYMYKCLCVSIHTSADLYSGRQRCLGLTKMTPKTDFLVFTLWNFL